MLCDAHCHLELLDDMPRRISELREADFEILAVGTTPKAYQRMLEYGKDAKNIHIGLGFHPQLVGSGYDDIKGFEHLVMDTKYIGEIGLDFSSQYLKTRDQQIKDFKQIIYDCEYYGNKTVSIHSLRSCDAVIDTIGDYKESKNYYILHWFTGTVSQMKKAVSIGCYFSINPRMLRTSSGRNIIQDMPLERVLLETDAPFAWRVNHISDIKEVLTQTVEGIAEIKGLNVDGVRKAIVKNSDIVMD